MYKKILAEIDGTLTSEASARMALKFAKFSNASFYLCFIHKRETKFEKAEAMAKRVFLEAEKNNLKVELIIKEGERIEEIKDIIKKEKIDIAFLPSDNIKKILKLPCSTVTVKIINMGKLSPRRILFIFKGKIEYFKENVFFIENFSKIFHAKVFINYFGADKSIDKLISNLKKQEIKLESKIFPKFSLKTLMFQALSKRVEFLVVEHKKSGFLEFFKPDSLTKLIENPPCNLIIFKPYHKE